MLVVVSWKPFSKRGNNISREKVKDKGYNPHVLDDYDVSDSSQLFPRNRFSGTTSTLVKSRYFTLKGHVKYK